MTETQKKILYILLMVLFVIAAAIAIYFVFFRTIVTTGPETNTNTSGNTNGLPSTNVNVNRPVDNTNTGIPVTNTVTGVDIDGDGQPDEPTQVTPVISDNVQKSLVTQSGKVVYYDEGEDTFYEADQDGANKRKLTEQLFPEAENVIFANSGSRAVIEFPDDTTVVYDFDAGQQYTLPADTEDFSFSPDSNALAYKYVPSAVEDRWIVTSNIDGSGVQFIEPIGDEAANVDVNWSPKGDIVATFRKSANAGSQEIFFVGQNQENFKSAVTEGRGFTGTWSPNGEQMLYSVYNQNSNYNPELYIMNASGDGIGSGRTQLNLRTWPDKCTFSGSFLYCAVPRFLDPGSGLYPELATNSNDNFYEVNLVNGSSRIIASPNGVSAYDMWLSSDGSQMYYRNARTGRIESIPTGG